MAAHVTEKVLDLTWFQPRIVYIDDLRFPTLATLDEYRDQEAFAFYNRCLDRTEVWVAR
jgi:hypothetical protein